MTNISPLAAYARAAFGGGVTPAPFDDPRRGQMLNDTKAPTIKLSRVFNFQSYFDTTMLQQAILPQPPNDPIVNSIEEQLSGYAIGLHPSSQTPIAVEFRAGGQGGASAPLILKPGQIERPHGLPRGSVSGSFNGFRWGLPFGWLGGGMATIHVFQTPDADVAWPGDVEVAFHRQRIRIFQPGGIPATVAKNWPMRFPWPLAVSQDAAAALLPQGGSPSIAIARPTRMLMQLNIVAGALVAPALMRMVLQGSNEFDLTAAGAYAGTCLFDEVNWPTYASLGAGVVGSTGDPAPVIEVTGALARLAADPGGMLFIDATGAATLLDTTVDVVRYGYL